MMNAAFLFITTIFLTVVNIFNITYKGNEINRIVTNLPLQILKSNVVIEEYTEDDFVAYFSKKETEESVKNYLNLNLKELSINIIYRFITILLITIKNMNLICLISRKRFNFILTVHITRIIKLIVI